jgi:hypothetical protein
MITNTVTAGNDYGILNIDVKKGMSAWAYNGKTQLISVTKDTIIPDGWVAVSTSSERSDGKVVIMDVSDAFYGATLTIPIIYGTTSEKKYGINVFHVKENMVPDGWTATSCSCIGNPKYWIIEIVCFKVSRYVSTQF